MDITNHECTQGRERDIQSMQRGTDKGQPQQLGEQNKKGAKGTNKHLFSQRSLCFVRKTFALPTSLQDWGLDGFVVLGGVTRGHTLCDTLLWSHFCGHTFGVTLLGSHFIV